MRERIVNDSYSSKVFFTFIKLQKNEIFLKPKSLVVEKSKILNKKFPLTVDFYCGKDNKIKTHYMYLY